MRKKLLYVGETQHALSGYGTMARNILYRLHKRGWELAEFASYSNLTDTRNDNVPWPVYVNEVVESDPRRQTFNAVANAAHGSWRFERVLLDYKPDIVFSWRDVWCDMFIKNSPLRPYFSWVYEPTYDSFPSKEDWLDAYLDADVILTYSRWAADCLRKECPKVKTYKSAPPTADQDVFKPVRNKGEHLKQFGLPENSIILGMVARNQIRKIFPDLMLAFRQLLDRLLREGKNDIHARTFLYIHTSIIDIQAWDLAYFVKEYGLANKTLFTYTCKHCHRWFPSFFQDVRTYCIYCNENTAVTPSVGFGVSDHDLANIYNLMSGYVHIANCEGRGVPVDEALACGLPSFMPYSSAMKDFVDDGLATPIKIGRTWYDIGVMGERVYIDLDDLVEHLASFLTLPTQLRHKKTLETAKRYREIYSWDKTTDVWEEAFNKTAPARKSWDAPVQQLDLGRLPPENISDASFVEWLFREYLNEPENAASLHALGLIKDFAWGYTMTGKMFGLGEYNTSRERRNALYGVFKAIGQNKNNWEMLRANPHLLPPEDYVEYANLKK